MINLLSLLERFLTADDRNRDETAADWGTDPLRHPDIARMDPRELGDLPFPARPVRAAATCYS